MERSLKHASWLIRYGFCLIPLNSNSEDRHYRKRPRDKDWINKDYSKAELQATFRSNYAIGARVPAGYVVIDVDVKDGKQGLASLAKFPQEGLFDSSYATTGSGGFHIFFRLPDGVDKIDTTVRDLPDIDFRCVGSQVVAAGSMNADGKPYTWDETTQMLEEVDIPEMPDELWQFLLGFQRPKSKSGPIDADAGVYSGDELSRLLDTINVEDYREHDEWFKVLAAVHEASAGSMDGLEVFYDWCQRDREASRRISREELTRRWRTFDSNAIGGITRRFLESIAAPSAKAHNDFDSAPPVRFASSIRENTRGAQKLLGNVVDSYPVAVNGATSTDFEVLDPEDDGVVVISEDMLDGPLEKLNDEYAVVQLGGKTRIVFTDEDVFGLPKYEFMTVQDFMLWTRDLPKIEEQRGNAIVQVHVAEKWLEWAGRTKYRKVDFFPGVSQKWVDRNYPGSLNLWTGWAVEPEDFFGDSSVAGAGAIPPEECKHFTQLICHLSGEDASILETVEDLGLPETTRYLLDWLSYSMARPHQPIGVAVAIRGGKGIGKGVLSQFLQWMTGGNTMVTADMDQVVGKFNANLRSTVFLVLDEALWSGSRASARRLQNIITEPMLSTEEKGFQPISTRNSLHILLFSNDEWIVPASGDDERRYAVLDADSGLKKQWDFWKDIETLYSLNLAHRSSGDLDAKKLRLGKLLGWLQARGEWLIENGWIANNTIPQTEALEVQKDFSRNAYELWWDEVVLGFGELGDADLSDLQNHPQYRPDMSGSDLIWFWAQDLRDSFLGSESGQLHAKAPSYNARGITTQLGRFLSTKFPESSRRKVVVPVDDRGRLEHSSLKFQAYQLGFPLNDLKGLARKIQRKDEK